MAYKGLDVKRPPKKELKAAYAKKGIKPLARDYGVSAFTITKWLHQHNIPRRETNSQIKGSIPTNVFSPILTRLLDEHRMFARVGGVEGRDSAANSGTYSSQIEIFGHNLKAESISDLSRKHDWMYVSSRRMTAIIGNEAPRIMFDTADRLLCALDSPFSWHTEPTLREWYWEGMEKPDWEDHVSLVEGLKALAGANRESAKVAAG